MKTNKKKSIPPPILPPKLEADVTAFMKKQLASGKSTKSVMRITHRRFYKVINKELKTNPEAQLQLQKLLKREALSKYRWYVRVLIQATIFISRFIRKPKPHGT